MKLLLPILLAAGIALFPFVSAQAERIKDIATIDGVRGNQLLGFGVVVGLDNTGDTSAITGQGLANLMNNLGLTPGQNFTSKNTASVMVTASLPAFIRPGGCIRFRC